MVARNFWKHSAQKASFSHLKLGSGQAPTGYSMSFQKAINISMAIQWSWSEDVHPQQVKGGHLRFTR